MRKVGDKVKLIRADLFPELIGKVFTIEHVGPWYIGDMQPGGTQCLAAVADYMIRLDDGELCNLRENNIVSAEEEDE